MVDRLSALVPVRPEIESTFCTHPRILVAANAFTQPLRRASPRGRLPLAEGAWVLVWRLELGCRRTIDLAQTSLLQPLPRGWLGTLLQD